MEIHHDLMLGQNNQSNEGLLLDGNLNVPNQPNTILLPNYNEQLSGVKRRFSTSCLSMKTVLRWRMSGDVNLDHLYGCSESCSLDEKAKADAILKDSGQLVCIVCNTPISANKKAVRRHQTKNRNHVNYVSQLATGHHVIDRNSTLHAVESAHLRPSLSRKYPNEGRPIVTNALVADSFQLILAKEAWDILCNPEKILNIMDLQNILGGLGICDSKDLIFLDEDEVQRIGVCIKPVPKRRFLQKNGILATDNSRD